MATKKKTLPEQWDDFFRGCLQVAKARGNGHTTEQEAADLETEGLRQAHAVFSALLGTQPRILGLPHFTLDELFPSKDGRAARRTDKLRDLALVEAGPVEVKNPRTGRFCICWRVTPAGVALAELHSVQPLDTAFPVGLEVRKHYDKKVGA